MKNRYKYQIMEIADEVMAVPTGESASQFRGVIKVNDVTASILQLLESDISEKEIIAALMKEYNASEEAISDSVHTVLETLRVEGLLVE